MFTMTEIGDTLRLSLLSQACGAVAARQHERIPQRVQTVLGQHKCTMRVAQGDAQDGLVAV